MRKWIAAAALALSCMGALTGTAKADAGQMLPASVGYYPGALISLPALVAKDQNFFQKEGLSVDLVPITSGPAMTAAVASGSVTFVNNSWDNLLIAVEQGLPVRGVAGSTVKMPFTFIARKGLPLPHLAQGYPAVMKDLVGKNWGVLALGVSLQYIEETLLTAAGYHANDVTYLAVGLPNTALPALQRGTVDTYLSIEPLPSIVAAKHEGTVVLNLYQNQGPAVFHDLGYNGWWASTTTIKDKPQIVARFVKAMQDSYCWYSDPGNFDRLVAIMHHYAKVPALTDAEYKAMVKRILPGYGLAITPQTIDAWSQLLVKQKLLRSPETRADVIAKIGQENFACKH